MFGFEDSVTVGELVLAAQAGSREAFTELLARFHSRINYWAFLANGDWCEAEDICQEVSLRAWRRLHQVDKPDYFAGWLKTMTHRMAISRRNRRVICIDGDLNAAERIESRESSSEDRLLVKDTQQEVRDGLQLLRKLDRETLVAFYIKQMSIQEMAVEFKAPLGTIKRRLHVARHRLAEKIQSTTSV